MYCSSCGAESIQGLQYCKRCGANLTPADPSVPTAKPRGLAWIVAFGIAMMMGVPMGGIAVVFERVPDLLERGLPLWLLTALAITSLLMMTVATVLLSRLLSPVFKSYLQLGEEKETTGKRPSRHAAKQISGQPYSVSSVTEGTTRTFESVEAEQNRP